MAESFFDFARLEEYVINRYLSKKMESGQVLVTAEHGGWALLSQEEFELLRKNKLWENPNLFNLLKQNGIIITNGNMEDLINDYRRRFSHLTYGVNLHIISPTLRCNHSCIYCHAKSRPINAKGFDMDRKTAKAVVDFIFQSPAMELTVEFQGGEPLANFPLIEYITEYATKKSHEHHKNIKFLIVSNLTLVDDDILKFLLKNNFGICTSLDGPKKVHDRNRKFLGSGGSYKKVSHWVKRIRNEFNYKINALPTITKFSLPYAKEVVDVYVEHGIDRIRMRHLINSGFAHQRWERIGYSAEEFLNFWKKSVEHCISLNKKGVDIAEGMTILIARKFLSKDYQSYTCWNAPCGAALGQVAYDWKGNVYTCDEARSFDIFRLGNVKENNYKEIFCGQQALNMVDLSSSLASSCEFCVWKPFCGNCLVTLYGEQGSLIPKIPLERECTIRKGMIEHVFSKILANSESRSTVLKWANTKIGV